MIYCQYCLSSSVVRLKGCLYCKDCEIYYKQENKEQIVSSIPLEETNQTFLKLCKKYNICCGRNDRFLYVKTVNEYYRKLPFCKPCKQRNRSFIRNFYFKNFLLNKEKLYDFSKKDVLLLILYLISYLALDIHSSIRGVVSIALYIYVQYKRCFFSYFYDSFICLILFFLRYFEIVSFITFLFCFYRVFTSKSYYFKININPANTLNINDLLNKLKIN